MCQIHGLREEKRKVTFRIGENETEKYLVWIKKEHDQHFQNPWEVSTCLSDSRYR